MTAPVTVPRGVGLRPTADGAVRVHRDGVYLGEIGETRDGRVYAFAFGGLPRYVASRTAALDLLTGEAR